MFHLMMPPLMMAAMGLALWQWALIPTPRGRFFNLVGAILLVALPLEIGGYITLFHGINNSIAYSIFGIFEIMLVLAIVHAVRPDWKYGLIGIGVVILLAFVLNFRVNGTLTFLLTEAISVSALLLAILVLAVLWDLAQTSVQPLQLLPEFWLFVGFLIYFGGMIPIMAMTHYIYSDSPQTLSILAKILPFISFIRYLLAALACRMAAQRPLRIFHG